jgi:hypothetical protein
MKRIALSILVAITVVGAAASDVFALDKNGNYESKQERDAYIAAALRKTAGEINAQTPIQIDEDTQLLSVIALQKTITFSGRLSNYKASEVEPSVFTKIMRENLNHVVCQNKATRDLIDLGVEYIYLFRGNDGIQFARLVIKSYRC